jgi:hypothetical protein
LGGGGEERKGCDSILRNIKTKDLFQLKEKAALLVVQYMPYFRTGRNNEKGLKKRDIYRDETYFPHQLDSEPVLGE